MIARRHVVVSLGAALLSLIEAVAQPTVKTWRVGFLASRHVDFTDADNYYGPFRQGMRELGYVEGKNLVIEWRSAEGKAERLPELAAELVRLKVDILVTAAQGASLAAQKATTTIPIVVMLVADPVGVGLVKSLARPGGSVTGLSNLTADLGPKLLELLRGMTPNATPVAVMTPLLTPGTHNLFLDNVQAAAPGIGVRVQPLPVSTPEEITSAFAAMSRQKVAALIVQLTPLTSQLNGQIAELASKQRLPSIIGGSSQYVEAGGLMSYGPNLRDGPKRAATYVDRIFRGANPGELPVEQPTQFELVVNLKTATALGIKVPRTILIQATRVIE